MTTHEQIAIPEETLRFIWLAIPSVPYLEALLLLRATPAASWDAAQVGRRLYLGERSAQGLLEQLDAAGMVADGDGRGAAFRYAPQSPRLGVLIDGVALAYARNLIAVSNLIHSKSNTKARQFADAFVFRKLPENSS